jgi:hypothetical protein
MNRGVRATFDYKWFLVSHSFAQNTKDGEIKPVTLKSTPAGIAT